MPEQTAPKADIQNCIHKAISEFLANEITSLYEGAQPQRNLDQYLYSAWNLSGLTADTLESITKTGMQVWNRIQPEDDEQMSDLVMQTDEELSERVSEAIQESYNTLLDVSSLSTTHRAVGAIGKAVLGATAGLFLLASVAATNLSCTNYAPSTVIPAGVASVESGSTQGIEKIPDNAGAKYERGAGCLEMRLNMEFNSTTPLDKNAQKKINAFVRSAAEAGHTELYCTGLASSESAQDGLKPVNDDDKHNIKLAQKRAVEAAKMVHASAKALGKTINVNAGNYGETEAFGKTDLAKKTSPRYMVNPENRTVIFSVTPIDDLENETALAAEMRKHPAGAQYTRQCVIDTPERYDDNALRGEVTIGTPKLTIPEKEKDKASPTATPQYTKPVKDNIYKPPESRTVKTAPQSSKQKLQKHKQHKHRSAKPHRHTPAPEQAYDNGKGGIIRAPGGGKIDLVRPGDPQQDNSHSPGSKIHLQGGATLDVILKSGQSRSTYQPPAPEPAQTAKAPEYKKPLHDETQRTDKKPAEYSKAPAPNKQEKFRMPPADAATKAYEKKMLQQYPKQQREERKAALKAEKETKKAAVTPTKPAQQKENSAEKYFRMLREQNSNKPVPKATQLPNPIETNHLNRLNSSYRNTESDANKYLKLSDIIMKECGEKGKGNTLCTMPEFKDLCSKGKPNVPKDTYSVSACKQAKANAQIGLDYSLGDLKNLEHNLKEGPSRQTEPKVKAHAAVKPENPKAPAVKKETTQPEAPAQPNTKYRPPQQKKDAQLPVIPVPAIKPAPQHTNYTTQPQKKPSEAYKGTPAPAQPKTVPRPAARPAPKPPAITATLPTLTGNSKDILRLRELGSQIMKYVRLTNAVKAECESDGTKNTLCTGFGYQCNSNDPRRAYDGARFSVCNKAWAEARVGYNIVNGEYSGATKSMQHADRNDPAMKKALEGYQKIIDLMNKVLMDVRISNKKEKTSSLEMRIDSPQNSSAGYQKDIVYYSWSDKSQERKTIL